MFADRNQSIDSRSGDKYGFKHSRLNIPLFSERNLWSPDVVYICIQLTATFKIYLGLSISIVIEAKINEFLLLIHRTIKYLPPAENVQEVDFPIDA